MHLITRPRRHSSTRSPLAAISAPTKFGMRSKTGPTLTWASARPLPYPLSYGRLCAVAPGPSGNRRARPFSPRQSQRYATGAQTMPARSSAEGHAQREICLPPTEAATICTTNGSFSPSVHTGATTTGRPYQEDSGWVKKPEVWPHQHLPAVEHELSSDRSWSTAGSRRREQEIDVAKKGERLGHETGAEIFAPA